MTKATSNAHKCSGENNIIEAISGGGVSYGGEAGPLRQ